MSKMKPRQELYRPGSGPLKKSGQGMDEYENDKYDHSMSVSSNSKDNRHRKSHGHYQGNKHRDNTTNRIENISDKFNDLSLSKTDLDSMNMFDRKREKRPEQAIYVPKPIVQGKDCSDKISNDSMLDSGRNHRNNNIDRNMKNGTNNFGSSDRLNANSKRSKKYGQRRHAQENDQESWRTTSPARNHNKRDIRQGSEPRSMGPDINRTRDSRSVEPSSNSTLMRVWQPEKMPMKPPSGRRNSGTEREMGRQQKIPNLDHLPPRLKRKFLEENGYPVHIETNSEDCWDGSSITFQGSSNFRQHPEVQKYDTRMHNQGHHPIQQQVWASTLPHMRPRGRGRLRANEMEFMLHSGAHRPITPDHSGRNDSRPCTPLNMRTISNEHLDNNCQNSIRDHHMNENRYKDAPSPPQRVTTPPRQYRRQSLTSEPSQLSPVSSLITSVTAKVAKELKSLDWSEEVEMNAEIEETHSDAMTRSSSMASLTDSCPTHPPARNKNRRNNRDKRNRSSNRNGNKGDRDRDNRNNQNRRNSSADRNNRGNFSRESSVTQDSGIFKIPESRDAPGKNHSRGHSSDRNNRRKYSREPSVERCRRNSERDSEPKNWREEIRERKNSEKQETCSKQAPGIIVLPRDSPRESSHHNQSHRMVEQSPRFANQQQNRMNASQKTLFDHKNPNKPILVTASSSRVSVSESVDNYPENVCSSSAVEQTGITSWYNPLSNSNQMSHCRHLIENIEVADCNLQWIMNNGGILYSWEKIVPLRNFLKEALRELLIKDIKFCQMENIENHFWKILFYNIIEVTRKEMANDSEEKQRYKELMLQVIEDGTKYLEGLLKDLEDAYDFKLESFLGLNNTTPPTGLKIRGLALVSAQKLFLFLGDLARYKEELNETTNYWKSREWYIKAQQINPKNGRPYNQLAILSMYSRKKLDAVYYYMRSLMSSNPFLSARDRLVSLFDEIRRKYEQSQRKRREEKAQRERLHMKEREKSSTTNCLRKEIWIHPEGGRRIHHTTSAQASMHLESDEEDLSKLSSSEVNKRFVISYLHVHGKLITKIGMETFQEAALQMLKEFRALLQHSPIPINSNRLLKLLALNMFAIESTKLKDTLEDGYRSEVQERALVLSLQMFNLILERCVTLLKEQIEKQSSQDILTQQSTILAQDTQVLLPSIKIWCDWMICHNAVWNPPPSCSDYKVGPSGDVWNRLATLMNLLEKLNREQLAIEPAEGYTQVRLPEDADLSGFTPLLPNPLEAAWARCDVDVEDARMCFRVERVLFFGTCFLCGLDPPVLKYDSAYGEYASVVQRNAVAAGAGAGPGASGVGGAVTAHHAHNNHDPLHPDDDDDDEEFSSASDTLLLESFSEDEGGGGDAYTQAMEQIDLDAATTPDQIRELIHRKEQLERQQRTQEKRRERVQTILQQSVVSVEIEIKPRNLVPDTNCFIDYLPQLQAISRVQMNAEPVYTLMVPLIVLNELEGLARGGSGVHGKTPVPATRAQLDAKHVANVAEAANAALAFLRARGPAVRCVTTRGAVLNTTRALVEDDDVNVEAADARNDDRILATCLNLGKNSSTGSENQQVQEGQPRRIHREVVLLTDDRNLRVKALSRDVPVRELPNFMRWAGIHV